MLKIAVIYGAISGTIIITVMALGIALGGHESATGGQVFGYLVMLVALILIFVGVKRYRDQKLGGVIKFGPALGLGLAITFVASVFHVIGWEISLAATDYAFMETYPASLIAAKEKAGLTGEELQKFIEQVEQSIAQYRNPLFRMPLTLIEIFPVGALVALVSAALLRNPKLLPAR